MTRLDLDSLELFVRVVELGSINAAAAAADRSQQAVSERMRKLEHELGLDLLERGARGSQATETGQIVAEWTADLLSATDRFHERLASLQADRRSNLRVAASQTIAGYLVPLWLRELQQRGADTSPHVLAVNSVEVIRQVHAGLAAIGFIESLDEPSDLRKLVVGHDELVVVVAPGHEWASRDFITAAELAAMPLVVRETGSGTRQVLEELLRQQHPHLRVADPAAEFSAITSVRSAVTAGIAPAVMSALTVADDLATGRLRRVDVADLELHRPLTAIWRDEPALSEAAEALIRVAAAGPQTP
ncbi:LysR family transcriptional regulator [Gulosibacter faecalis]|uniref:LysR family transcriptional regulator n=1 Tax=Gulosibacter faecalis TaxID=272240 RepID=A0ABW5UUP6_9MICO|nr:LysR family transcriptional regulator [Gulosibacter faecalis]